MLTWDQLRCVGRKLLSFQNKTGHIVDYLWHAGKPFQLPKTWLVSPRCVVTADVWVHVLGKLHIYFIAQISVWEIGLTNQCALPWNMNSFAALSLNPVINISSSTIFSSHPLTWVTAAVTTVEDIKQGSSGLLSAAKVILLRLESDGLVCQRSLKISSKQGVWHCKSRLIIHANMLKNASKLQQASIWCLERFPSNAEHWGVSLTQASIIQSRVH